MKFPFRGFLLLCLLSLSTGIRAQSALTEYYTFEKDSGSYSVVDTSLMQSISEGDVWVEDDVYEVPIPFKFRFLDKDLSTLKINQTNIFLPERDYFLATFGNFLMYDLANKDTLLINGLSPIAYKIDKLNGYSVMKIQWINAGFFFDSTMFLNVQVWLYEHTNTIEIRYGKSNVRLKYSQVIGCGPFAGIAKVDTVAGLDKYELFLRGNSSEPATASLTSLGKKCLNDVPREGTIYRFIFHDSAKIQEHYPLKYNVFPNPSRGLVTVGLTGKGPYNLCIYDLLGNKVLSQNIRNGEQIDLSNLRSSIYEVKISEESVVYSQLLEIIR